MRVPSPRRTTFKVPARWVEILHCSFASPTCEVLGGVVRGNQVWHSAAVTTKCPLPSIPPSRAGNIETFQLFNLSVLGELGRGSVHMAPVGTCNKPSFCRTSARNGCSWPYRLSFAHPAPHPPGPSRPCSRSFLLAEPLRQFILSHCRVTWSTRTSCQPQSVRSQAPHSESKGYSCRAPSERTTHLAGPTPSLRIAHPSRPSLHRRARPVGESARAHPLLNPPFRFRSLGPRALQRACALPCLIWRSWSYPRSSPL